MLTVMRVTRLAVLLCGVTAPQHAITAQPSTSIDQRVDEYIRDQMERRRIPGLSLAVVRDGRIERLAGYGFADLSSRTRATPSTVYQTASVTKVFAGTAIMALAEEGRVALADPVTRYVDGLPRAWSAITLWHCLTHTTGLADVSVSPSGRFTPATADEAIASVALRPTVAPPGDTLVYQVIGYLLLGKVVERVTGLTPAEFLRQRLFAPLGMSATRYAGQGETVPRGAATLYRMADTAASPTMPLTDVVRPTTFPIQDYDHMVRGLFSTVEDIAKYDVALSEGRVLEPETLRRMWAPVHLNRGTRAAAFNDPSIGYAGGWMTYHSPLGEAVGHIGGNMAQYLRFLDRHLTVVVLTNAMNADARTLAEGIAKHYLSSPARDQPDGRVGQDTRRTPVVDRVVRDLCGKRVALLGESPTHGFGEVLRLKTDIARRLVEECRFNAFFIESGAYDFLKIQKTLKAGRPVDQSAVAAAIGGLWAHREVEPLIPFLLEKAQRGTLVLGGLDDQLGRGTYAQQRMAFDLVESLRADDRQRCLGILQRHMLWQYGAAAPYGPKDKALILGCLDAMDRTLAASGDSVANEYELAMIQNLRRNLARDFRGGAVAGVDLDVRNFNDRDRSMSMNFQWFMSRLPARSKVIVWTATTHAAKTLRGVPGHEQRVSLGSYIRRRFASEAFVLGFSAYSGTYGMARQPARPLAAAPANSLEGRLFDQGEVETRYLDPSQLQALGKIPARLLGADFKTANWSDVLDGVVIVREEHPPHPSAR
jgi:CubicO group peptidase (beta-lactamase class C family)/erythromycin esterase-like protein